ncbi:MAG: lipoate--protein ligase family protein [Pirellulales bacterium]|nr:lipoate--protein ligase family protein [Pirellulales bacterium]
MRILDHTCATAAENLAFDEALLEDAEASASTGGGEPAHEVLRFWEADRLAVVLGRGCRAEAEVDLAACRRDGVPVLRRPSGGGTVLVGPGSLMYTLVLSCRLRPELRAIDVAHRTVLERQAAALRPVLASVRCAGTSDLAIDVVDDAGLRTCKISGNSLRVRRDWILYHGTLLFDFAVEKLSQYLLPPPREPAYREHRGHAEFVTSAPIAAQVLREALVRAWQATESIALDRVDRISARTARLVAEKYSRDEWNLQL